MYNINSRPKEDHSDDEFIGILNSPKLKTATKSDNDHATNKMEHQILVDLEERQKLTVFGYIRQRAEIVLPLDIIKLFVTFYKSQDDWNRLLSHHTIEIDDDYIANHVSGAWAIGFGQDRVRARSKEWVLKVFRIDSAIIGIVPSHQIHKGCNSGDYTAHKHQLGLSGYGLCESNGVFYGRSHSIKQIGRIFKDDVVIMRLDLTDNTGTLSYKINDGEYKVATDTVPVDHSWTLAVGFYGSGKVQLLR